MIVLLVLILLAIVLPTMALGATGIAWFFVAIVKAFKGGDHG